MLSSRPRSSSSVISVPQPASSSADSSFTRLEVVLMRVPAKSVAERDFDERHAALDQPAGEQAALAEEARCRSGGELRPALRPDRTRPALRAASSRPPSGTCRDGRRTPARCWPCEELLLHRVPQLHAARLLRGADAGGRLDVFELQIGERRVGASLRRRAASARRRRRRRRPARTSGRGSRARTRPG